MSHADEALQRAIADACLGDRTGDEIATDLRTFLVSRGVVPEDVEAILAAPGRLAVYRSLIRNGIGSVVLRMLPRTRAHLEAACPGRFEADLRAFASGPGPRTHYLRELPGELLAWATPRWRADPAIPAYLVDLATHELAHFEVASAAPASSTSAPIELALDRPLVFAAGVRVQSHAWAVHELALEGVESGASLASPVQRDVTLLAYRDAAHTVRWLELSPLAAAIISALVGGATLGIAVASSCAASGLAPSSVLPDVARLLTDLGARGILLGARDG